MAATAFRHDFNDFRDEKRMAMDDLTDSNSAESTAVNDDEPSSNGTLTPPSSEAVGIAPEEFYAKALAPWRLAIRRFVMRNLQAESELLARMQRRIRSPWLDAYFKYMSTLGTHTFFMVALPMLFFFGYAEAGRGLIFVLAMGVYASSFIKDLVCAPRPYSPPVSRLTIGSHHLEYGFPSTHSTNSVSMALYIFSLIHAQYINAAVSTFTYATSAIVVGVYIFSIVFGRVYTGMHSITDCVAGVILGTSIWAAHALWWPPIEDWLSGASTSPFTLPVWGGPVITTVLAAVMVHKHPQPVDDCPCFEDAIAFVSVLAGTIFARWAAVLTGYDDAHIVSRMAGEPFPSFSPTYAGASASASDAAVLWRAAIVWWGMALLKLSLGITLIFAWRLLAKALMHSLLPRFFRVLAFQVLPRLGTAGVLPKGTNLPHRRFYTPATEYDGPVPDGDGLRPIPSVMDLTDLREQSEHFEMDGELGGMKRRRRTTKRTSSDYTMRYDEKRPYAGLLPTGHGRTENDEDDEDADEEGVVKHYDADVLTKVVVYTGIGILATGSIPFMFEVLGWGVHP